MRRIVTHYGHQGPEGMASPEFLGWLTDPVQNGAALCLTSAAMEPTSRHGCLKTRSLSRFSR